MVLYIMFIRLRSASQPGPIQAPSSQGSEPVQNGTSNLMSFNEENSENERRLHSGVGGLYEPTWMGQCQSQTACEEDDFMDLGVPGSLPIRSSRSYETAVSTFGEVFQGQSGVELGPPHTSSGSALPADLPFPLKEKRVDSRPINIKGFTTREQEPVPDIPALPGPPSAARRFTRSASRQQESTAERHQRLPTNNETSVDVRGILTHSVSTPAAASLTTPTNGRATSPVTASESATPAGVVGNRSLSLTPFSAEEGTAAVVSDEPIPMSPGYDL